MTEDRIIEIETKLAFQEDMLKKLNDVVFSQQQKIDKLDAINKILLGRIEQLTEDMSQTGNKIEKPPHY